MRKKIFFSFLLTTTLLLIGVNVSFGQEDNGPILDNRCTQEKLLNKNGCYATGCWDTTGIGIPAATACLGGDGCEISGNKESEMSDLIDYCNKSPNENDWGMDFSAIYSDIVFNRATMPLIFIMVITVVFGMFGLVAIGVAILGYIKWMNVSNKGESLTDAWKYFTNGLIGIAIISVAIPLVWLLFYVAGYQINPFDFDDVFDRLLLIDCPVLEENVCKQYDVSCVWTGASLPGVSGVDACINVEK